MKSVKDLELGFSDAQNYTEKEHKQMFNEIFIKNLFLDQIIKSNIYFLIGEKGTGKTAYAVYLNNNNYKDNKSILSFIAATDYEKFYTLKKKKQLELTDYVGIWKVIILLLLSKSINQNDIIQSVFSKSKLNNLLQAIDEYYLNAFSPEIITALKIVDETELAAKLICKYSEVEGKSGSKYEFTETRFQMNLFYIEKQFSDEINKLKLNKNINLFIDGIDIRPNDIPYNEYIDCIRGLTAACWSLNTGLFQNVKDTKGHFKVILLLRPDIYDSLNLQNATNKLMDNSVYLDWRTSYEEYLRSALYNVSNKLLSYKQINLDENDKIWDHYFSWKLRTTHYKRDYDTAFMEFLRISLSRPRDILIILQMLQRKMIKDGIGFRKEFDYDTYNSDEFQNSYSEYFMSSLKDQLSFYYSAEDYKHFIKFFDFFDSEEFTYHEYDEKYNQFLDYIFNNANDIPKFLDSSRSFLQLLYDSNIICAVEILDEGKSFFHFSYREKSISNISPEVMIKGNIRYRFHYGLYKRAKFGRV